MPTFGARKAGGTDTTACALFQGDPPFLGHQTLDFRVPFPVDSAPVLSSFLSLCHPHTCDS